MPTNLYGPNDNFDLETSHVLPALIRKFHEAKLNNAKSVTVWGTGSPKREFLHVDDLAEACLFLMNKDFQQACKDKPLFNIGTGRDISIKELAKLIKRIKTDAIARVIRMVDKIGLTPLGKSEIRPANTCPNKAPRKVSSSIVPTP